MSQPSNGVDHRVYLTRKGFEVAVKTSEASLYCHRAEFGGGFHLIADGEIYVRSEEEAFCLNCAIATAVCTDERPNLDRGNRIPPNPIPPNATW